MARRSVALAAIAAVLVACAAPRESVNVSRTDGAVAEFEARKCGVCHRPPEPGLRDRAYLEAAFSRHGKRVHLATEQWRALLDFLAAPMNTASSAPLAR